MANQCPQCGSLLVDNDTCQTIFDKFLALEYSDPSYGEVHLLTVACFMIQHNRYSDEALKWIENTLRDYLEGSFSTKQVSINMHKGMAKSQRKWKVAPQPDDPNLDPIHWSMTITDVDRQYNDSQSYRELVRDWARITLKEMHPLLNKK